LGWRDKDRDWSDSRADSIACARFDRVGLFASTLEPNFRRRREGSDPAPYNIRSVCCDLGAPGPEARDDWIMISSDRFSAVM
jgi:hypothetical protein